MNRLRDLCWGIGILKYRSLQHIFFSTYSLNTQGEKHQNQFIKLGDHVLSFCVLQFPHCKNLARNFLISVRNYKINLKVEVWVYKGRRKGGRQYRFFVGGMMVGYIWVMGNKKYRIKYLFSRTKLEERNPIITYSNPDMKYTFDIHES